MPRRVLAGVLALCLLVGCGPVPPTGVPTLFGVPMLFNRPSDPDRCLQTYQDALAWLPDAIARQASQQVSQNGLDEVDWSAVLEEAALEAGIRKPGLNVITAPGDDVMLVGVDWCYGLVGYDLYVVDAAGHSWLAGTDTGIYFKPEITWLDGVWGVVVRDYSAGVNFLFVTLVGQQDGEWTAFYRSDMPGEGFVSLTWQSSESIDVWFEDGYRFLIVRWKRPADGVRVEMVYEWQDESYVNVEVRELAE